MWYLDEVYIRINGQQQYLWRAVDQDGDVIDILVRAHRDQRAAESIGSGPQPVVLTIGRNNNGWFGW